MASRRIEKFPIGPILEYLGQPLPGGRRSGKVKAKCSFHDDNVASAQIDYQHNRYRCYACDESGDAIELIMRHEGVKFEAAKQLCADITGQAEPAIRDKRSGESGGLFGNTGLY